MATIWRSENFSPGLHTKPARTGGGESYAADIENLQVDGDGFLRLRSNFRTVGPGGANITGVAASEKHLFVLRENGKLYIREIAESDSETEVQGVSNLKGRISIISRFRDYVVLTSEGPDQGFWIDVREGRTPWAYQLGLDSPVAADFTLASAVPIRVATLSSSTAFVAYAITYVRQFEEGIGEADQLFNTIESAISPIKYHFTQPITEIHKMPTKAYLGVMQGVRPLREWVAPSRGSIGPGQAGLRANNLIVSYTDSDGRNQRDAITAVASNLTGKIVRILNIRDEVVIDGKVVDATLGETTISIALCDVRRDPQTLDGRSLTVQIEDSRTPEGLGFKIRDYYPAILSFEQSEDPQVTGINLYRSWFFRDPEEYTRIRSLIDNNDPNLDLSTLQFRKIAHITDDQSRIDGVAADGKTYISRPDEDLIRYIWMEKDIYEEFQHERLPTEAKQIHYHAGRIFAPVGDRLVYSDFDGTISRLWTFPKKNEIRRTRPGRVDFCVSHREVLLFGGHDGLYRLTGTDPFDFDSDEISGVGPLDGYSWGTLKNSIGFVGSRGLYLTDASSVQLISEKALDGFFDAQIVQDGAVLFFEDDTMLFYGRLQSVDGEEISDSFFLFDDQHWVRWTGETVTQFASNAGRFYVSGNSKLKQIQWRAGENTDADLPWVWESNLIHAQEQGAGNITKRFTELLLSAAEGTDITLKTWVDTQGEPTEREFKTRDDLYFQRIPIERLGRRLRFRLEGTGPVTIRGIQIEGEVGGQ